MVFLLLTFAKSGNSAGCLLAVSHILTKTQFLVCSRSRCHVTQWSLGICEGLVLGPPRTPKSAGAQAPEVYKMVTFAYKHCLHIGSNKVRLHITSFMWIQCSAWHAANLSFPFWNILWFFFPEYFECDIGWIKTWNSCMYTLLEQTHSKNSCLWGALSGVSVGVFSYSMWCLQHKPTHPGALWLCNTYQRISSLWKEILNSEDKFNLPSYFQINMWNNRAYFLKKKKSREKKGFCQN